MMTTLHCLLDNNYVNIYWTYSIYDVTSEGQYLLLYAIYAAQRVAEVKNVEAMNINNIKEC